LNPLFRRTLDVDNVVVASLEQLPPVLRDDEKVVIPTPAKRKDGEEDCDARVLLLISIEPGDDQAEYQQHLPESWVIAHD
jgi:hypothetical protein